MGGGLGPAGAVATRRGEGLIPGISLGRARLRLSGRPVLAVERRGVFGYRDFVLGTLGLRIIRLVGNAREVRRFLSRRGGRGLALEPSGAAPDSAGHDHGDAAD